MSLYCSSCLSICLYTRPSLFFSNAFPDIGSVGRIKKKKKTKRKTPNRRPGTYHRVIAVEPGNNKTWPQNIYGRSVCCCYSKVKTTWRKGSTTKTPMQPTSIPHFSVRVFCIKLKVMLQYSQKWFLVQHRVAALQGCVGLKVIVINRPL